MEGLDFSRFEASLYGDAEDDADLLAELEALEREQKSPSQRSASRAPVAEPPARARAAAPQAGTRQPATPAPGGEKRAGAAPLKVNKQEEEMTDDDEDASVDDDADLLVSKLPSRTHSSYLDMFRPSCPIWSGTSPRCLQSNIDHLQQPRRPSPLYRLCSRIAWHSFNRRSPRPHAAPTRPSSADASEPSTPSTN